MDHNGFRVGFQFVPPLEWTSVSELPKVGPITDEDIEVALKNTRPSAHLHAHRYDKFNADYGSQILQ
ncbi:unnamed protein product [Ilex paraguariensis]|uniref:Uncharacterized protein n=1 Tax=Ilex paraguariensis TaxID=185542 RepID=A0ABC8RK14_9AQUA